MTIRMRIAIGLLAVLALVPFEALARAVRPVPRIGLSEWGVWLFDRDRVTLGDLARESPAFVHRVDSHTPAPIPTPRPDPGPPQPARKPVIFFNTSLVSGEMPITIRVGFRNGMPWLHFPGGVAGRVGADNGLVFTGRVGRGRPTNAPAVPASHFWNHLRTASSSHFTDDATGESEAFVFYDGPADVQRSFRARVEGDSVKLTSASTEHVAFVVRGGTFARVEIGTQATVRLASLRESTSGLSRALLAELTRRGLPEPEANALVRTWSHELAEEQRLHVISFVSRNAYDAALPMTVTSGGNVLARVGVVIERL